MGSQVARTCNICGQLMDVQDEHGRIISRAKRREGLVFTVGYSRNGWGHRTDLVNISDEICEDCFAYTISQLEEVVNFVKTGIRGGKREFIHRSHDSLLLRDSPDAAWRLPWNPPFDPADGGDKS